VNTRAAYGLAAGRFLRWCEGRGITRIEDVQPIHPFVRHYAGILNLLAYQSSARRPVEESPSGICPSNL
jgi:hypothetical protein